MEKAGFEKWKIKSNFLSKEMLFPKYPKAPSMFSMEGASATFFYSSPVTKIPK